MKSGSFLKRQKLLFKCSHRCPRFSISQSAFARKRAASGSFILFHPPVATNNSSSFSFISRPESFIEDTFLWLYLEKCHTKRDGDGYSRTVLSSTNTKENKQLHPLRHLIFSIWLLCITLMRSEWKTAGRAFSHIIYLLGLLFWISMRSAVSLGWSNFSRCHCLRQILLQIEEGRLPAAPAWSRKSDWSGHLCTLQNQVFWTVSGIRTWQKNITAEKFRDLEPLTCCNFQGSHANRHWSTMALARRTRSRGEGGRDSIEKPFLGSDVASRQLIGCCQSPSKEQANRYIRWHNSFQQCLFRVKKMKDTRKKMVWDLLLFFSRISHVSCGQVGNANTLQKRGRKTK